MELNYSLLFYLKKPKNYLSGEIPVYMRFTVDGIPKDARQPGLPTLKSGARKPVVKTEKPNHPNL